MPRRRRFAIWLQRSEQYFCCPKVETKTWPHCPQSSTSISVNDLVRRIFLPNAFEQSVEQNR